jgi:uncharacterized membrane protein YdbT with pleckstrin-like domain
MYFVVAALAAIILYAGFSAGVQSNSWMIALVVPAIILISTLWNHIRINHTYMAFAGDRLKFESGVFARTSRSVPLAKVQDVTVSQSLGQRILGLGDLTIETAGEDGRLQMKEIRSPRVVSEQILDRVAEYHPNRKNS